MQQSLALLLMLCSLLDAAAFVQVRAVEGSPCVSADNKCYLGATIVSEIPATTTNPTFNASASITILTDPAQIGQVPGTTTGFKASITCDQLANTWVRYPDGTVGFSHALFTFPSKDAGSYSLKVSIDANCVEDNAAVQYSSFASSCGLISSSGACWAVSYTGGVRQYNGQNTPVCRTSSASGMANSVAGCMNNATYPDVWAPTLMLASPSGYLADNGVEYVDSFFTGTKVKLYFNEPVMIGTGKVCFLAYSSAGVFDPIASSCVTPAVSATISSAIEATAPAVKNRRYYITVDGNAVQDLAGNYFPGINGRRFTGFASEQGSFPDQCRVKRTDDASYSWPAGGLQNAAQFCQISFVRPLGAPISYYPAHVSSAPKTDAAAAAVSLSSTPADTELCYTFAESIFWDTCGSSTCFTNEWSFNAVPSAVNLQLKIVSNFSSAYGTVEALKTTCTSAELGTNGRAGCAYSYLGTGKEQAPGVAVSGGIDVAAVSGPCWLAPSAKQICCKPAATLRSSAPSMLNQPNFVMATLKERAIGFAGEFTHSFWVNATDAGTEKPRPLWVAWEGKEVDLTAGAINGPLESAFTQIPTTSLTGQAGYYGFAGYKQGIHVHYNRHVTAGSGGYVKFVPHSYLQRNKKTIADLRADEWHTSDSTNPGCLVTATVYEDPASSSWTASTRKYGSPCRIPVSSAGNGDPVDALLYSNNHLIVNPRSLMPGETYTVIFDNGTVVSSDSSKIDTFHFTTTLKQSINWGSSASDASRDTISPRICCYVASTTNWRTSLASIYAMKDAGYVHYSQTFMTTFYGPVRLGRGNFNMKCQVDGLTTPKVTINAQDRDQIIPRGHKLFIDPRDPRDGKDGLWVPADGTTPRCYWEADEDAIIGLPAGTQISPFFQVELGDRRSPVLLDVTPYAKAGCSATSDPPCVTQTALAGGYGGRSLNYAKVNSEDAFITLTFDEMVKFGPCDITLSNAGATTSAELGRTEFIWDLDGVTTSEHSAGVWSVGKSAFSSVTNQLTVIPDITAASGGAAAQSKWLSVRLFDLQKAETNTESGTGASGTACTASYPSGTETGFCSHNIQRTYQLVLQLPGTKLTPLATPWNLKIPHCAFYDWAVEATNAKEANGVVSGHADFVQGADKVITIPIKINDDVYAPNITYSPCGRSSSTGPQGRKVLGHCFNLAGVEPSVGSPSYYEYPQPIGTFEFQGPITGLIPTNTTGAGYDRGVAADAVAQGYWFPFNKAIKQTVPVMLEFDEDVTIDGDKKCIVSQAIMTDTANSDSSRIMTSELYTGYQSGRKPTNPIPDYYLYAQNYTAESAYDYGWNHSVLKYPDCQWDTRTTYGACRDNNSDVIMSQYATSYTWLKSATWSDYKPDSTTTGDTGSGTTVTESSTDAFQNINYFTMGDTNFVQYNGSYSYCLSAATPAAADFSGTQTCATTITRYRLFFFLQFTPITAYKREGNTYYRSVFRLKCEAGAFKDAAGNIADQTGVDYRFTFYQPTAEAAFDGLSSYPVVGGTNNKNCTDYTTCTQTSDANGGPSVTNTSNIMWSFTQPVTFQPFSPGDGTEWGHKLLHREGPGDNAIDWRNSFEGNHYSRGNLSGAATGNQLRAVFFNGTIKNGTIQAGHRWYIDGSGDLQFGEQFSRGFNTIGEFCNNTNKVGHVMGSGVEAAYVHFCEKDVSLSDFAILSADNKKMIFSTKMNRISEHNTGSYDQSNRQGDTWAKYIGFYAPEGLFGVGQVHNYTFWTNKSSDPNADSLMRWGQGGMYYESGGENFLMTRHSLGYNHSQSAFYTSPDNPFNYQTGLDNYVDEFHVIYGFFNPALGNLYDLKPEVLMVLPGARLNYGLMNPDGMSYREKNAYYSINDSRVDHDGPFGVTNDWLRMDYRSGFGYDVDPMDPLGLPAQRGEQTKAARKAFQQVITGHANQGFSVGLIMSDAVQLSQLSTKSIKIYDCGEYVRMYGTIVNEPNCNEDSASKTASGNWASDNTYTQSSKFLGTFSAGTGKTADNAPATLVYEVTADGRCKNSLSGNSQCVADTNPVYISMNNSIGLNLLVDMVVVSTPWYVNFTHSHKYTMVIDDEVFYANQSFTNTGDATKTANVKHTGLTLKSSGEPQADSSSLIGSRITPWYIRSHEPQIVKAKLDPADGATMVPRSVRPKIWFNTAMLHADNLNRPIPYETGMPEDEFHTLKPTFNQDATGQSYTAAYELVNHTTSAYCTGLICTLYHTHQKPYFDLDQYVDQFKGGRDYTLTIPDGLLYDSNGEEVFRGFPRADAYVRTTSTDVAQSYSFSTEDEDIIPPTVLYCCVVSREPTKFAKDQCDNGYSFNSQSQNITTKSGAFKFKCVFSEPIMFSDSRSRYFSASSGACTLKNDGLIGDPAGAAGAETPDRVRDGKALDCTIKHHSMVVTTAEDLDPGTNYTFYLDHKWIRDYSGNKLDLSFNGNQTLIEYCDPSLLLPMDQSYCADGSSNRMPLTIEGVPSDVATDDTLRTWLDTSLNRYNRTSSYKSYKLRFTTGSDLQQEQCWNCDNANDWNTADKVYATASNTLQINGFDIATSGSVFSGARTNAHGWPDLHIYSQSSAPSRSAAPSSSNIGNMEASFYPNDRVLLRFNRPIVPYLSPDQTDAAGLTEVDWSAATKIEIQDCGPDHQCNSGLKIGGATTNVTFGSAAGYSRTETSKLEVVYGYDSIYLNPGGATPLAFIPGHKYRVTVPAKMVKMSSEYTYGGNINPNGQFIGSVPNYKRQFVEFVVSTASEDRRIYSPLGESILATQYLKSGVTGSAQDNYAIIDKAYDDSANINTADYINNIDSIKGYILLPSCENLVATLSSSATDPGTTALSTSKVTSGVTTDKYVWIFFPEKVQANTENNYYAVHLNRTVGTPNNGDDGDAVYEIGSSGIQLTNGYYLSFQLSGASNLRHNGLQYSLGIANGALFTDGGMKRGTYPNANPAGTAATSPMAAWQNLGISDEVKPKWIYWHKDGHSHIGISQCFKLKMASYEAVEQVDITPPVLRETFPANGTLAAHPATMMFLDFYDNSSTLAGSTASSDVELYECNTKVCDIDMKSRQSGPDALANFQHCCDASSCASFGTIETRAGVGKCSGSLVCEHNEDIFVQPYTTTSGEPRTRLYMKFSSASDNKALNSGKCYTINVKAGLVADAAGNLNDAIVEATGYAKYWFRTQRLASSKLDFTQPSAVAFEPAQNAVGVEKYRALSVTFDRAVALDSSVAGSSSLQTSIYLQSYDPYYDDANRPASAVLTSGKKIINCDVTPQSAEIQGIITSGEDYTRRHDGPVQLSDDGKTLRVFPQGFDNDNRVYCLIISSFAIKDATSGNYFSGLKCGDYCFTVAPFTGNEEPRLLDVFPRDQHDMSVNDVMNVDGNHWYMFDKNVKPGSGKFYFGMTSAASGASTKVEVFADSDPAVPSSTAVSSQNYLGHTRFEGSRVFVWRDGSQRHGQPALGYDASAVASTSGKLASALSAQTDYRVQMEFSNIVPEASDWPNALKPIFREEVGTKYMNGLFDAYAAETPAPGGSADYQRAETGSGYCNGTLFRIGGTSTGGAVGEVCKSYDHGITWNCDNVAGMSRKNPQILCTRDYLYVVGSATGASGIVRSADMGASFTAIGAEGFTVSTIPSEVDGIWQLGPEFPYSGFESSAAGVVGAWKLVVCGGGLEKCWKCASADCSYWEQGGKVADQVRDRHGGRMFANGQGDLILIGGSTSAGVPYSDVWRSRDGGDTFEQLTANIASDGVGKTGAAYTFAPRTDSCLVQTGDDTLHIIGGRNDSVSSTATVFQNDWYTSYPGRLDYFDSNYAAANEHYIGSGDAATQYAARPTVIGASPHWKQKRSIEDDIVIRFSEMLHDGKKFMPSRLVWVCRGTSRCSSTVGTASAATTAGGTYVAVCNVTQSGPLGRGCCQKVGVSADTVPRPIVGAGASASYLRIGDNAKSTIGQSEYLSPSSCDANAYTEIRGNTLSIKGLSTLSTMAAAADGSDITVFIPEGSVFDRHGNTIYSGSMPDPASATYSDSSTSPTGGAGFEYYFTAAVQSTAVTIDGSYPAHATTQSAATSVTALDTNFIIKFGTSVQKYWNQAGKYLTITSQLGYSRASAIWIPVNDSILIDNRTALFQLGSKRLVPGHQYFATLSANGFIPSSMDNTPPANMADNHNGKGNSYYSFTFFTVPKIADQTYVYGDVGSATESYRSAVPPPACAATEAGCNIANFSTSGLSDATATLAVLDRKTFPANMATDVPVPTAADCSAPAPGTFCLNFQVAFNQHINLSHVGYFEIHNGSATQTQTQSGWLTSAHYKIPVANVIADEVNNITWFQVSSEANLEAGTYYEIYIPRGVVTDYNSPTVNTGEFKVAFRTLDASAPASLPKVAYASVAIPEIGYFKTDLDIAACSAATASDSNRAHCLPTYNGLDKSFNFVFTEPVAPVATADGTIGLTLFYGTYETVTSPQYKAEFDSGNVRVTVADSDIAKGLTASDTCLDSADGCLATIDLRLPNRFVQNKAQSDACAADGTSSACSAGFYNGSVGSKALTFKTYYPIPASTVGQKYGAGAGVGFYPANQATTNYYTISRDSALQVEFSREIFKGLDTATIEVAATHSAYNSRTYQVSDPEIEARGRYLIIRHKLAPGEKYTVSLSNSTVRDVNGYLNTFGVGDVTSKLDRTSFGVAPLIRFRQNFQTASSDSGSETCDYAGTSPHDSTVAECIGFTPRAAFGTCVATPDNRIVVAGGHCVECGSFNRQWDAKGTSLALGGYTTDISNKTFSMATYRQSHAGTGPGAWKICDDSCSDTEKTESRSVLFREASLTGLPVRAEGGAPSGYSRRFFNDELAPRGKITSSICSLNQCMDCISGPKDFSTCAAEHVTPAFSSESSDFFQTANGQNVTFACLPGYHVSGQPQDVREFSFTCKASQYDYTWDYPRESDQGSCADGPSDITCVEDSPPCGPPTDATAYDLTDFDSLTSDADSSISQNCMKGEIRYNSKCAIKCPVGYNLGGVPGYSTTAALKCMSDENGNSVLKPFDIENPTAGGPITSACKPLTCSADAIATAFTAEIRAYQILQPGGITGGTECGVVSNTNKYGDSCSTECKTGHFNAYPDNRVSLYCACEDESCTNLVYREKQPTAEDITAGGAEFNAFTDNAICTPKTCPALVEAELRANEILADSNCTAIGLPQEVCGTTCAEGYTTKLNVPQAAAVSRVCRNVYDSATDTWAMKWAATAKCVKIPTDADKVDVTKRKANKFSQKLKIGFRAELGSQTKEEFFQDKKNTISDAVCSSIAQTAFGELTPCMQDFAAGITAYEDYCTDVCSACMSCDVSLGARRTLRERRRLAEGDLNLDVTYEVEATPETIADYQEGAEALDSNPDVNQALETNMASNLDLAGVEVSSVTVESEPLVMVTTTTPAPSSDDSNTGAIIGGVIGGLVGLAIIGFVAMKVLKK